MSGNFRTATSAYPTEFIFIFYNRVVLHINYQSIRLTKYKDKIADLLIRRSTRDY
jgi:hypothetical protein